MSIKALKSTFRSVFWSRESRCHETANTNSLFNDTVSLFMSYNSSHYHRSTGFFYYKNV